MYNEDNEFTEAEAGGNAPVPEEPQNAVPEEPQHTAVPAYSVSEEPQHTAVPAYSAPEEPQHSAPPVYAAAPEPQYTYPPAYNAPPEPQYTYPPVYNTPPEQQYTHAPASNLYSPGIFAEQPSPKAHGTYTYAKSQREGRSRAGAFLRAMCLVLVCVLLSAAAAYLVIDFRIERGDLAPATNQVVLGRQVPLPAEEPSPAFRPTAVPDEDRTITAQDIYEMAKSQAVGISITPPENAFGFGMQGSVPSVVGSGFIISSDGYILTNYHVVEMAHGLDIPINVVLYDGSTHEASVVGFEASSDVAVLKIEETGLSPTVIGDSDNLRVGQAVYAVGNPFGDLVYTMTDGIVSAIDRVVSVDGKTISTFQFSAAVNSGNSGGPIYNASGEVIGIVTAKVTRGNVEGIGFAIPINDAVEIATALIEHGYISGRPWLGISVQDVTEAHAEYFEWVVGIYIRGVTPGSAADKAGILPGDIITGIGDEDVNSLETLRFALRKFSAGDTTTITVWRSGTGETLGLTITFDEDYNAGRPGPTPIPNADIEDPFTGMP